MLTFLAVATLKLNLLLSIFNENKMYFCSEFYMLARKIVPIPIVLKAPLKAYLTCVPSCWIANSKRTSVYLLNQINSLKAKLFFIKPKPSQ